MGSAPYALSVHNFISSVGADAGFASIIGLAILVLLYFAHARETSALREQAAMLADRLQDAEARLAEAARSGMPIVVSRGAGAQAAGAHTGTPGVPAAAAVGAAPAAASPPGPPAGLAAPALASATRVVPLTASVAAPAEPTPAPAPRPAPAPAPPAQARPAPVSVPAPATAAAAMSAAAIGPAPATSAQPVGPSTETPPGAANGHGQSHPRPIPAAATRQSAARLPNRAGSSAAERRPFAPLTPPSRERSSAGRVVAALIGIVVLVGAVAVLLVATSSSGTQNRPASTPTTNTPSSNHRAGASFNPAKVTVSVLNGTAVNQLAARVLQRLTSDGYRPGTKADAPDQTMTSTTVAYLSGFRTAAMHVAASLRLPASSVKPIDQSTLNVACQGNSTCAANVVVTVGANLANG